MLAQSVGVFFVFYLISILFTLSCNEWFLIWVGLEINMMSFIALVYDRSSGGVEVCLKYFFIQSIGSGILMMMFYTEFDWFEIISLLVLSYKMGGGPFFFWFPSICENLGWGCCFILMTVQKILPLLLISFLVSMFLWMIILSSIVAGAIGSMNQKKMKRLMAFSSVHHIGWILFGNFLGGLMWMIYLLMYSLMIMGIMWGLWKDKILDVGMLGKVSSKWSFVLGMLSMGGMPPMLGFYMKWWLFYYLLNWDFSLLIFMVIMSVLMFYVYLRVVYGLIMGSVETWSWMNNLENKKFFSLELFYMMGINIGVVFWMIMYNIKM
uniref:NADH-ubiquinone oxidoreductase chain 2 n=1 Tax=Araneus diadematus TaxID=45920 RepID=A0A7L7S8S7_ARADI|nr:NADH dehydrogenase subunit 2 [Araneus diadematus]